jgi:hypothetical protein
MGDVPHNIPHTRKYFFIFPISRAVRWTFGYHLGHWVFLCCLDAQPNLVGSHSTATNDPLEQGSLFGAITNAQTADHIVSVEPLVVVLLLVVLQPSRGPPAERLPLIDHLFLAEWPFGLQLLVLRCGQIKC